MDSATQPGPRFTCTGLLIPRRLGHATAAQQSQDTGQRRLCSHLTWFRVLTGSGHLRALRLRGPCGAVLRRLGNGNELGLGTIDSRNGR